MKGSTHPITSRRKQYACPLGSPANSIGTQRRTGSAASFPAHSLSATQRSQSFRLANSVFVQLRVAGSHDVPPHTASSSTVHSTHSPAATSHTVVPARCSQSALDWQGLQLPDSHAAASGSVQSLFSRHSAHSCCSGSQNGVGAAQWSVLSRHPTQARAVGSQTPVAQSLVSRHSTHSWVAGSHAGVGAAQWSVLSRHSTHSPVAPSHTGVLPLHASSQSAGAPPAPLAPPSAPPLPPAPPSVLLPPLPVWLPPLELVPPLPPLVALGVPPLPPVPPLPTPPDAVVQALPLHASNWSPPQDEARPRLRTRTKPESDAFQWIIRVPPR